MEAKLCSEVEMVWRIYVGIARRDHANCLVERMGLKPREVDGERGRKVIVEGGGETFSDMVRC